MTAEQKWKQYDNDTYKTYVHGICDAAQQSREAYKSALRKAIEGKIAEIKYPEGSEWQEWETWNNALILLDQVNPE
jgi:hypothetical protein